jgi:hypothetical protein
LERTSVGGNDILTGGSSSPNVLHGDAGAYLSNTFNNFSGTGGTDTLIGGAGDDQLWGGPNDAFVFAPGSGADTINDFDQGNAVSTAYTTADHDKIDLKAYHTDFSSLTVDADGSGNAVVHLPGSGNSITLVGITSSQFMANHADYFLFA